MKENRLTTQDTARARVAKGAAYLDRVRPGWFQVINIANLSLMDGCRCVLAQTYDCSYREAAQRAGLADPATSEGKAAVIDLGFFPKVLDWTAVQDAWIDAIADRRCANEPLVFPAAAETVAG